MLCKWQQFRFQDVFGLMITVHSIQFKPINHLNAVFFFFFVMKLMDIVQSETS